MHADPVFVALKSRTAPFQAKGNGRKSRNRMHLLHDIITLRNLIYDFHSRFEGSRSTAVSRDRVNAGQICLLSHSIARCSASRSSAKKWGVSRQTTCMAS